MLLQGTVLLGQLSEQSCFQVDISPEFGKFSVAFLGTFDKNGKVLWYFFLNWELFGSFFGCFWQICRNSVLFWELFQHFGIIWKLFGAFLTNFEIAQNFLRYFLCYFLKNSEFGRTSEFREQGTALFQRGDQEGCCCRELSTYWIKESVKHERGAGFRKEIKSAHGQLILCFRKL